MDIMALIKERKRKNNDTKSEQNIQLTNKLEKCLLTYLASKSISTIVRKKYIYKAYQKSRKDREKVREPNNACNIIEDVVDPWEEFNSTDKVCFF